jgi:hypothetical protein
MFCFLKTNISHGLGGYRDRSRLRGKLLFFLISKRKEEEKD